MADFKGTFIVTIVQSRRRDTLQCYREVPEGESERASEKKEKREKDTHTHTQTHTDTHMSHTHTHTHTPHICIQQATARASRIFRHAIIHVNVCYLCTYINIHTEL